MYFNVFVIFFFNDTATTEIYTLSLHDALPISATILTPDPERAARAWRELAVGTVKINAVFGGAPGGAAQPRKASGLGFGYGPELLDEVTVTKVVHHAVAPRA